MEINPKEEIKEELAKMDAVSDVYIENMELKEKLKKQSKELEELREKNSKLTKLCSLLNYTAKEFEKESENYDEILELWPQVMLRSFELLKEKEQ